MLDISKKKIIQPIIEGDMVLLFNGEIYDPISTTDTLTILPLYQKYGPMFVNKINGEFAILILDRIANVVYLFSDIFATKPLFYCIEDNEIGISSYLSELKLLGFREPKRVKHSSFITINLSNLHIEETIYHTFNLDEYKTTYQDCILALEKSLNLRCNTNAAVGLSSGHDSGSILLWSILNNRTTNHFYFVTNNREDLNVMSLREQQCNKNNIPYKTIDYYKNRHVANAIELQFLSKNMENFITFFNENGVCQISKLLRTVKKNGLDVFITGQGSDEILTNYKNYSFYENLNLKETFPWPNVYEGKNRKFIDEFEYVGGCYGVEVRYPFLDKNFVQEFLNLTNKLKQTNFKSVLTAYMSHYNFPINLNKVGMGIID